MSNFVTWGTTKPIKNKYKEKNPDAEVADKRIKHCLICNICWEGNRFKSKNTASKDYKKRYYRYYKNFPSYGKIKQTCPKCEVNK